MNITIDTVIFKEAPLLSLFVNSNSEFPAVDVFKTNVRKKHEAEKLISMLLSYDLYAKANFDLEDCDKILRIESKKIKPAEVIRLMTSEGFECIELT